MSISIAGAEPARYIFGSAFCCPPNNKVFMNEEEQQELIALIEQRMNLLRNELAQARTLSDKKQTQSDDAAANLDITINAEVDGQRQATSQRELEHLLKSLNWLQTEDGGYCQSCGEEIPLARLKAVPSTRHCVACA